MEFEQAEEDETTALATKPISSRWTGIKDYLLSSEYANISRPMPTTIAPLDEMLGGGFTGGVWSLMAAPGAGKSAFAVILALWGALNGRKTAIVSLEMPASQVIWRCTSAFAKMMERDHERPLTPFRWSDVRKMRLAAIEQEEHGEPPKLTAFEQAAEALDRAVAPYLFITDDETAHNASDLIGVIVDAYQMGCSLVVIDYLQQVRPDGKADTMFEQSREVMSLIKNVANSLDVAVLLIVSANRQGVKSKELTMHDGSGGAFIEYDSVGVMTLQTVEDESTSELRVVRLKLHKNRNGVAGKSVDLFYRPEFNMFAVKE